jgi:hypothetical protein
MRFLLSPEVGGNRSPVSDWKTERSQEEVAAQKEQVLGD